MQRHVIISLFLSLSLLSACQTSQVARITTDIPVNSLYLDAHFSNPAGFTIESEQDIFMLDDEMLLMVENHLNKPLNIKNKAEILLKQIFSKENLSLSYSVNSNLTARETFHSQQANCLSLTIMAYALAKEAKLNVDFQEIDVPEYWIRNGQYNFLTGHVNLLIRPRANPDKKLIYGSGNYQIDFDPYSVKQEFPTRVIGKNTVLAMFYNNKGGHALANEEFDIAYQYFKAATKADKYFSPAWGNLAVLYRLTNHVNISEKSYRYAIQLNPNNLTALTNLALLLRNQQHNVEASLIERKLLIKRIQNPYYHAVLADESYYNHDYLQALKHYKKAIKLNNNIHEVYFGMAKAYYQMNRLNQAKKALLRALKLNRAEAIEHQYIAKLNLLKAEITN